MRVVYAARYRIDIGQHVFPTRKYELVHSRLLDTGVITPADIIEPVPVSWDDLSLVHTAEYLEKMRDGSLSSQDVAQLELPWSQEMVDGFRLMVGGTVQAARMACGLDERSPQKSQSTPITPSTPSTPSREFSANSAISAVDVVAHIGGGLHHAFPNHGEGFCPFNDVAVAVRVLQREGIERVAIVDADVHHGNGTAFIFESDPRVFTFSIHQQHNYPMWKPASSLDIGLPDGAGDSRFLSELSRALPRVLAGDPQCVFYLAGADPYEDDQLGGLRLTREGLRQRDRMVIEAVRARGLPLVIVLAGGYARRVDDTVSIHAATIEEADRAVARSASARRRS
jgi:acetoin utilization deacetylase AcuC-like enzyme